MTVAHLLSKPPPPPQDMGALFARVFRSEDGNKVLEHLISLTLARGSGHDISRDALFHLEGQRHLIKYILNTTNRGDTTYDR